MSWTAPDDLKAQVQKLWDRGAMLASLADGPSLFPQRFTLKEPSSRELSEQFPAVRKWIAELLASVGPYRIEWRSVNHRVVGSNQIPVAVWIDQLRDALGWIGKQRAADQFTGVVLQTRRRQPALLSWLTRRPLRGLEMAGDWPRLLDFLDWMLAHPRPGIYLRQIDLPGVHTKLLEKHRGVLAELLDLVLPEEAIDTAHTGVGGFCSRYGFLDKPLRVRFRLLDPGICLLATNEVAGASCSGASHHPPSDQDITLTHAAFAALNLPAVSRVFITENEINFLAFPPVPAAMVIFGAGYGFENLATAGWLQHKDIFYWGDIDTHGFAILNQLRATFPRTRSLLMDQQTLLAHRPLWGVETQPETANLARLNAAESVLYDQLRQNHWGDRVRLEQERIGFEYIKASL
jgi:hypothetical protein